MQAFVFSGLFLICAAYAAHTHAAQGDEAAPSAPQEDSQVVDDSEFNTNFLDPNMFRGIDKSKLKKMLATPAGLFGVEVHINGKRIDTMQILFKEVEGSDNARPCLNASTIQKLKLKTRFYTAKAAELFKRADNANSQSEGPPAPCLFINEIIESAHEKYDRGELILEFTVPQAASKPGNDFGVLDLNYGESAGFSNYSASSYQLSSPTGKQSSQFVSLNAGVNLVPWQIRSSVYLSQTDNSDLKASYGDYLIKRTFVDWKSTLMLGNLNSQSQTLGGVTARGMRLSSEEHLMPYEDRIYNPTVKGIARSNARVQLKQNGLVFSEQNVPPGPFEFDDLRPPSNVGDIEVIVTDAGGGQQQFYLPYSNVGGRLNPGSVRYSLMFGQYQVPDGSNLLIAQGGIRYGWNEVFTPSLEYFISERYVAAATGVVLDNFLGSQFGSLALSNIDYPINASGYSLRFGLNGGVGDALRLSYQRQQNSENYFDPSVALSYQPAIYGAANNTGVVNGLSLSTNIPSLGTFSFSYSSQDIGQQTDANQNINLSYSRFIAGLNLYASANRAKNNFGWLSANSNWSANVGVSIPIRFGFGGGNLTADGSASESGARSNRVGYNGRWNEHASYGLTYGAQNGAYSASLGTDISHSMGSANLGVSQSSTGSTQLSLGNSGSIVLHRNGFLMGPSVGDTFGIVEVPSGKDVQIQGQVGRLNSDGFGLISYLSPFADNQIYLDLEKSNMDLELDSTVANVAPVSGSIVRLAFKSRKGYPLLVTFTSEEEIAIPVGANLLDESGATVGVSGPNNGALARVAQPSGSLTAKWGDLSEQACIAAYGFDAQSRPASAEAQAIILKCQVKRPIPIGSEIFDTDGEEIAITGQGGRALVRVKNTSGTLKVQWGIRAHEFCQSDYAFNGDAKSNSNGLIPLRLQCK